MTTSARRLHNDPKPLTVTTISEYVDYDKCSARELIDIARILFDVDSLNALAQILNIPAYSVQRWHRRDYAPKTARELLKTWISRELRDF